MMKRTDYEAPAMTLLLVAEGVRTEYAEGGSNGDVTTSGGDDVDGLWN